MNLYISMLLCNPHSDQVIEYFQHLVIPPEVTMILMSVYTRISFAHSLTLFKRNNTLCSWLHLASFAQYRICESQPWCFIYL